MDQISLAAGAQYYDLDTIAETDICIQGYRVKTYEEGSLYRFIIDPVGDLEQERLNFYFYVTTDKIYRVWTEIAQGDEIVCFCGDDALLTAILDTDEKLAENSEIVCRAEEVSAASEEGESGLRYEIHRSGNQITYSRSDIQPNGERGFYEWFVWEEGAGLVEYGSGFKAEAEILYLHDITMKPQRQESGDAAAPLPPETEGLLSGNEVLDLSNHIVAYHVPREEIDKEYGFLVRETFQGEYYIAIQNLDSDAVWYLPDVYGRIMEIEYKIGDAGGELVDTVKTEEVPGVYLRYSPNDCEEIKEICIPVYFPEWDGGKGIDIFSYCPGRKTIIGTQQGLEAGSGTLPQKVWEETFQMEGEEYTVSFERVSPIYAPGYESGEIDADYRLTVQDREESILSQQMVFHYPVKYEEAHWLVDFSGDGFSDVAFCTDLFMGGKNGNWSTLKMLIWNADAGCYEEKRISGACDLPMWNMDMASLVVFADTKDSNEIYWSKEMYAWMDGQWQKTRRFEQLYSETEFLDMPGEDEKYPYPDGYRELVYSDGELVEENRIEKDFYEEDAFWFEENCIWSANYVGGIKLYPDWPEWKKEETAVGGIAIDKYIREDEEKD